MSVPLRFNNSRGSARAELCNLPPCLLTCIRGQPSLETRVTYSFNARILTNRCVLAHPVFMPLRRCFVIYAIAAWGCAADSFTTGNRATNVIELVILKPTIWASCYIKGCLDNPTWLHVVKLLHSQAVSSLPERESN